MQGVGLRLGALHRSEPPRIAWAPAVLARPPGLARCEIVTRLGGGVHPQAQDEPSARTLALAQWLEQPVVAKPAVGHHQYGDHSKASAQARDQHHRLGQLVGECERLAPQTDTADAQRQAAQIEAEGRRQTAPAPVDRHQQPHGHNGLRPRPARLIALGGMIEGALVGEDVLARRLVDRGVERQQQPSADQGVRDGSPQRLLHPLLGQLH
jgi:hypothetical protein